MGILRSLSFTLKQITIKPFWITLAIVFLGFNVNCYANTQDIEEGKELYSKAIKLRTEAIGGDYESSLPVLKHTFELNIWRYNWYRKTIKNKQKLLEAIELAKNSHKILKNSGITFAYYDRKYTYEQVLASLICDSYLNLSDAENATKWCNEKAYKVHAEILNDSFDQARETINAEEASNGSHDDWTARETRIDLYELRGWLEFSAGNYNSSVQWFQKFFDTVQSKIADSQNLGTYRPTNQSEAINNKLLARERMGFGYALLRSGNLIEAEKVLLHSLNDSEISRIENDSENTMLFEALQELRIRQGKLQEALEFSERGRALELSRLVTLLDSPFKAFKVGKIDFTNLKEIALSQNTTLVEYSLIGGEDLFIYVIQPDGSIHFRSVNLSSLPKDINLVKKNVVNWILLFSLSTTTLGLCIIIPILNKRKLVSIFFVFLIILTVFTFLVTHKRVVFTTRFTSTIEASALAQGGFKQDNQVNQFSLSSFSNNTLIAVRGNSNQDLFSSVSQNKTCKDDDECLKLYYYFLIHPIADLLPKNPDSEVVFIPHKDLFNVPWAALKNANEKYLIESHTIRVAPSIQYLNLLEASYSDRPTPTNEALVVGNPIMPKVRLSSISDETSLSQLPGAEIEAFKVANLLNTTPLVGEQASEKAVISQIENARVIHIATHGLLHVISKQPFDNECSHDYRDEQPKKCIEFLNQDNIHPFSALALGSSENFDGLLTDKKLYDLKYSADLVVLSACDTGTGLISSDGVFGLSRPFQARGVSSVIASLWSIPDAPTSELMYEFYRNYKNDSNGNTAKALRKAMLHTMKKFPEPLNWAGFNLIGNSIPPKLSKKNASLSLSVEEIYNGQYFVPSYGDTYDVVNVKFTNGKSNAFTRNGYAIKPGVANLGQIKLVNDLNNDGLEDVVISFGTLYGASSSGLISYLAILINKNGKLFHEGTIEVGRFGGNYVSKIEYLGDGEIEYTAIVSGPGDSACCTSFHETKRFNYRDTIGKFQLSEIDVDIDVD